ncbi:MAG: helicase C-terminal domain-containing protein [Candidatus Omnitrophota bacterium]
MKAVYGNKHLLVEAGTGVGKSIAYLLPFIKWTVEKDKKVVISTYTKTLQEQLTKKDLPQLKSILGMDFNFALCLGAANYLCLRRLTQNACLDIFSTDRDKNDMQRLQEWSRNTQAGLRTELNFTPAQSVWEKICRESDLCLGKKCSFRKNCFYYKAKAKEYKAHILVTNHHLFFANIASGGAVLPVFDAIVFDEAHTLEQVATAYLGREISNFKIKYLFDALFNPQTGKGLLWGMRGIPRKKIEEVRAKLEVTRLAADDFFSKLIAGFGQEPQTTRVRKPLLPDHYFLYCLSNLLDSLKIILESVKRDEDKLDIRHFISRIEELRRNLAGILNTQWPGYVYWFSLQARQRGLRLSLCSAPVDISQEFKEKVLTDKVPVILTSATISVNGKFDFIKENLGFAPTVDSLILDSPFDYSKNVLLYLTQNIPDPNGPQKEYLHALSAEIKEILKLTSGRTFILFTSFKMMNKIYEEIKGSFTNLHFLKHGEEPRYRLLEAFKSAGNNILLGTNTFWQGIDIPGKSLECVVITKLPFAVPDDPVTEARMEMLKEQGKNPFTHYQLPQAVTMLRQGFGRLIRGKSDRGMVAILDPRITTRYYGRNFLQAIPHCKRIYHLDKARSFFEVAD